MRLPIGDGRYRALGAQPPHRALRTARDFGDAALLAAARWCEAQLDPMPAPPDDALPLD